jgi:hypothetical protein
MTPFHYDGQPVTAAEAAGIINDRRAEWHRKRLDRARGRDERGSNILRQLWTMIRGRA